MTIPSNHWKCLMLFSSHKKFLQGWGCLSVSENVHRLHRTRGFFQSFHTDISQSFGRFSLRKERKCLLHLKKRNSLLYERRSVRHQNHNSNVKSSKGLQLYFLCFLDPAGSGKFSPRMIEWINQMQAFQDGCIEVVYHSSWSRGLPRIYWFAWCIFPISESQHHLH